MWEKNHGGSQFDTGRSVHEFENGTIFVAGTSRSQDVNVTNNNGQSDAWLYISSTDGVLLWEKNIGGSSLEFINNSTITANDKILVVGNSESNDIDIPENKGLKDIVIIKLKRQSP